MGPQHPSTHGVLRVILKLDGEKVNGLECVIGYLHRGIEKVAESRTWAQFAPFVDRLDYTAAVANNLGYCLAVENFSALRFPSGRNISASSSPNFARLASHQVWLGTHVLDIGAVTPLFYAFRDRETFSMSSRNIVARVYYACLPHRRLPLGRLCGLRQ
jgi:NADH-quinone oxidoreductase subunit D